jgi:hypothetical protein|nr:cache domain-containing protein [Candidatus Krumholzibacteria bacterium]
MYARPSNFGFLVILILATIPVTAISAWTPEHPAAIEAAAYRELDQVVADKQAQLIAYLTRISALADQAGADPLMRNYFDIKRNFWLLQQKSPPPPEARQAIEELKVALRQHYLGHYQSFYDVLFIDRTGYVLSTVRTQADYHKNLFEGDLARTALARRLQMGPATAFVDYEFYWVSDEPSAFFVEPLEEEGELVGWLVLQCALNRINHIFSHGLEMGRTGETFLVNRNHQMMTESRLNPGGEGLRRILARENVEAKFRERHGHKRVIDYRGFAALTSFTVCPVLGSEWLLVAKIDEDEVFTRYYLDHETELRPALLASAGTAVPRQRPARVLPTDVAMVDMDEYRFSREEPLLTFGVATCTAVLVNLRQGKACLGHASRHDRMYGAGDMDVLGQMMGHIRRFEIYPYQLRDLEVTLVARHRQSLGLAVDMLLESGLLLSQIRFLSDPAAEAATVLHYPTTGETKVRWTMGPDGAVWWQDPADVPNLGASFQSYLMGR